jgi:hypothetical protein
VVTMVVPGGVSAPLLFSFPWLVCSASFLEGGGGGGQEQGIIRRTPSYEVSLIIYNGCILTNDNR